MSQTEALPKEFNPRQAVLEYAKAWIDREAWISMPNSEKLSGKLRELEDTKESLARLLFELGYAAPDLLALISKSTREGGLREICGTVQYFLERVKGESIAPRE